MKWLEKILDLLVGIITGRAQAERSGATEVTNASLQAGVKTIRRANDAAEQTRREDKDAPRDPNDLDG